MFLFPRSLDARIATRENSEVPMKHSVRLTETQNKPDSLFGAHEALVRQRRLAARDRIPRQARPYVNLQVARVGTGSSCDAQLGGR